MQSLLRLPAAAGARTHRAHARALSTTAQPTAGSAPHAAAAPAEAVDNSFLARMIAPTRSTPMFRLMNPELFVERSKKVRSATNSSLEHAQYGALRNSGLSFVGLSSASRCGQLI